MFVCIMTKEKLRGRVRVAISLLALDVPRTRWDGINHIKLFWSTGDEDGVNMAEHNREKRFPALCNQIKRQMIGVGQTRAVDPSCSREKTLLLFSIRITTWPPAGATTTQGFSALLRQAQSGDSCHT